MQLFFALTSILLVPIGIVNVLSGPVVGIWLAILGEWWAIGYGLLAIAFGAWIISIALLQVWPLLPQPCISLRKDRKFWRTPLYLSVLSIPLELWRHGLSLPLLSS